MSATNRGAIRAPHDFYPTPAFSTVALLNKLILPVGGNWLEPCVGSGAITHTVNQWHQERNLILPSWTAVEIRPFEEVESAAFGVDDFEADTDFLTWKPYKTFDLVLTNPPFTFAMEFVLKSLLLADVVAMFLRLGFLGSLKRQEFHRRNPANVYVLPKRPSCTGDGKTDSSEYAWFVWDRHRPGGHWEILEI